MRAGILSRETNDGLEADLLIPFVAPTSIYSNQPVSISDVISLKQFAISQNVQRWEIETRLMPENDSANFLVMSAIKGHHNLYNIRMPQVYNRKRSTYDPNGNRLTVGSEEEDYESEFITTTADSASTSTKSNVRVRAGAYAISRIVVGEYINIAPKRKVHLVTAVTHSANYTTLTIFPDAIAVPGNSVNVYYGRKCSMYARLDPSTAIGITYTDGILSDPGSVKFIEGLE
jgi:hypothetical protein